jgi:predicted DNA binding CopG/RHH family protein
METVLIKISKEARQMLKIMSAKKAMPAQKFLSELIKKTYSETN